MKKTLLCILAAGIALVGCNDSSTNPVTNNSGPVAPTTRLKSGTLTAENGTPTVGTLTILKDANNQEWLHLNADFTSSFATGTVTVYLAKSAARIGDQRVLPPPPVPNIRAIGFVNQNGAQDLKISGSQQGFSHVVFYCETAEINFGNAPLVTP